MNAAKIGLLLAAMTALFLGIGFMPGGEAGVVLAFGLAVAMNAFAYWNSDKMVLRPYRAQPADARTAHMFIIHPLHGHDPQFSTPPKPEHRVRRVRELAGLEPGAKPVGPWG